MLSLNISISYLMYRKIAYLHPNDTYITITKALNAWNDISVAEIVSHVYTGFKIKIYSFENMHIKEKYKNVIERECLQIPLYL